MAELFSFRGLKGPKLEILAKVEGDLQAPVEAKAFITWLIKTRPYEGITLDCHSHAGEGADYIQHIHVGKLY